ncbi:hypothetical protein X777_09595, partial [Ooceraea biroi]
YLDFDNLPETNFSCQGKVIGGYYADVEAGCQMFHVCTIGQKDEIMDIKFLCLNGTVFDQETRVCERVDEVDCSKSERFYNLNLELYGNNAVTLSLNEDEDDLSDPIENHQTRTTSARPSTTSTTSTTTSRPSKPSTTAASGSFQHPAGYPQHYQPQPPFPQVHTSQSKSLYDGKNGGYHHQYIFHNGERTNNHQATSYQLFSNQGAVSSTTVSPPAQIHQIRYSSTVGPPQIIHNEPSTVTPLFHATSPTIQTLLNNNVNSPAALINPIFHNHGIASTTEHFTVHSNNPRETSDYRDDDDDDQVEQDIRSSLEAIQPANKGKVSKLTLSPVPNQPESSRVTQTETSQSLQQQQQRIPSNFLPTPTSIETTVRSFYPTPRPSPKPPHQSSVVHQITQHIHVSPGVTVPQLKPHHITINLPPPDIQRIEGDESFDPFYRDVPKIRKNRQARSMAVSSRRRRSLDQSHRFIYGVGDHADGDPKTTTESQLRRDKDTKSEINVEDFQAIKESLMKFRDILFSDEVSLDEASLHDAAEEVRKHVSRDGETSDAEPAEQAKDNAIKKSVSLEDLKTEPSRHLALDREEDLNEDEDKEEEEEEEEDEEANHAESSSHIEISFDENYNDHTLESRSKSGHDINSKSTTARSEKSESREGIIDVIILDSDDFKKKPVNSNVEISKNDAPIEIILEEETRSNSPDVPKTSERVINIGQIAGRVMKSDSRKQSITSKLDEGKRRDEIPRETINRKNAKNSGERKSGLRRKSARTRSSRRRISSKIKQRTRATATTISTTTMPPSSVAPFETKIAEQIDSHIFGEPESQTSKEVDTRAVDQRDATYSKSLQDSKGRDASKNKEMERPFDHQITESYGKNLEQHANKSEEEEEEEEKEEKKTESIDYTETASSQDTNFTEDPRSAEEPGSIEVTNISEENKSSEELFSKEYDTSDDETNANANNEEPEEVLEKAPNKISSHEVTNSRENNSDLEEESSQHDNNQGRNVHVDDEEREKEHSTASNSETTNFEELDEYQDTTDSSTENTHDRASAIQEDYTEPLGKEEDPTTTVEYSSSEEYTDSQEEITGETEGTESNTEGVLKFTDELPQSIDKHDEETKEVSETDRSNAYDYVDDNYEPMNYKEIETTVKPKESKEENTKEHDETEKKDERDDAARGKDIEMHQEDSVEAETHTEHIKGITNVADLKEVGSLTTTVFTTATTMMTTTKSPRPTTTTTRAAPPKLFKPVGVRKIYAFIPPTTTPVPVVIKPRLGLYNPKPAKPPRSYNELAPKPVIRKITLPTRKPATTTTTTATTTAATDVTTSAAITATAITTTEKSEENILESKLKPNEPVPLHPLASDDRTSKDDQVSSPSERDSVSPLSDTDERLSTRGAETFTPYPLSRLSTLAPPVKQTTQKVEAIEPYEATEEEVDDVATTTLPTTLLPGKTSTLYVESTSSTALSNTDKYPEEVETTLASTTVYQQEVTEAPLVSSEQPMLFSTTLATTTVQPKTVVSIDSSANFRSKIRKFMIPRKPMSFNCLEKEMYRFYGDTRDCRLFHYCSPGFTSRQVLDFRFVCEEGTAFDEETQSCRHNVPNRKCRNRSW